MMTSSAVNDAVHDDATLDWGHVKQLDTVPSESIIWRRKFCTENSLPAILAAKQALPHTT